MKKNISGFSLVEMGIVIVIIGLLVGGILVGRNIVEEGRRQGFISDINKLKAAMNNFKLKYNEVPGDMRDATSYWPSSDTGNGDGDESISMDSHSFEAGRVFEHLSLSGVYVTGLVYVAYTAIQVNIPQSKYSVGSGYQISSYATLYQRTYTKNSIIFGEVVGNTYSPNQGGIEPVNAYSIDIKMDDGVASSGYLVGFSETAGTDCIQFAGGGNDSDQASGTVTYNLDSTAVEPSCRMLYYLDE